MTATKDQEREALAKIRKIVESLGAGSYLEMTFAGCFEQAEENINNDFGNNYKELYEAADARHYDAMKALEAEQEKSRDLQGQIKTITEALEAAQAKIEDYKHRIDDVRTEKNQISSELMNTKDEVESQKSEIIILKAKLYDLMTA